jgi:GT2 family glycosyltransferase
MAAVSIIIINYNSFTITSNCIRSVLTHTKEVSFEIILVDNASTERNADDFLQEFPSLRLIKSSKNGGFAYGNNLGIAEAGGEYILLLNSDTLFTEDSVSKCVNTLSKETTVGVLGCRMTYPDGRVQYSARRFRSIGWELLDLFRFIPLLMPYKRRSVKMLGKYSRHDTDVYCDWVNGAFFLFRANILMQLPGKKLDDRFFMYGEDQLWCEQIKQLGYQVLFYAGTTIIHLNSGSTAPNRQLALRNTMMKHEKQIMKSRKGRGLYYFFFSLLFGAKEGTRNIIKYIVFRLSGRLIR